MNFNFKNKRVIIRVDFNVPLKSNVILDDTRIKSALPTINEVIKKGGAVVLMSHLGRPLTKKKEDGTVDVARFTLRNIVPYLSTLLGQKVQFCEQTVGAKAEAMAESLKAGQVLVVENTRFDEGETKGDINLAKAMSKLGEIYINDAFGTAHRAHASTAIIAQFFSKENKGFGLLMESEIANASKVVDSAEKPFTAILGGAKVSDKIKLINNLLDVCDNILIGGGMSFTFSKALGGAIGNSLCEDDYLDLAKEILKKAKQKGVQICLPLDTVITTAFSNDTERKTVLADQIPDGWMGLDIGEKTINLFSGVIEQSKTISWNGPQGVFEFSNFAHGTYSVAQAVANATQNNDAFSLIGGGDSVSAINKSGLSNQVSFISTGGGAMLEFLEGKELPGIVSIK